MRHVSDVERRARLGRRHALAEGHGAASVEDATRALTVLHATEPASVYLAARARVPGLGVDDVDRAVYDRRSLVRQLAMRRTLWLFPRDLLPAAWGSASARVATAERARMAKDAERAGLARDGSAWLDDARAAVLEALVEEPEGLTVTELRARVPMIDVKISVSAGSVWSASRVLTHLGLTADATRAANTGHWRTSRHRWTRMENWLDDVPEPCTSDDGYAELVARWLARFGPGSEDDLVWWLGATKSAVRVALARVDAVEVSLDGGATGWLHPDDVEPVADPGPWEALLPTLDPTVMGWKERSWYLGDHRAELFDRNGNAGTTVWVDGRVVGCWVQDDAGVVRLELLEQMPARRTKRLDAEAERLTAWLDGLNVGTVYPSPAMRRARAELADDATG